MTWQYKDLGHKQPEYPNFDTTRVFFNLIYALMKCVIIGGDNDSSPNKCPLIIKTSAVLYKKKHPEVQYSTNCLSMIKFFIQVYALPIKNIHRLHCANF